MRLPFKIRASVSLPICLATFTVIYGPRYVFSILAASALHEAGHLAAIYTLKERVSCITLRPFGAVIERAGNRSTYTGDALISISGPIVNLISFLICSHFGNFGYFASASLMLALVNLLPARPLDGYSALSAMLLSRISPVRAEKICKAFSLTVLAVIWTFSVYMLLYANFNVSLLLMVTILICETVLHRK